MYREYFYIIFLFIFSVQYAQHRHESEVQGMVFEEKEDGTRVPIPYANVYWAESMKGVVTDSSGRFEIHQNSNDKSLIISAIGYNTDTISIRKHGHFNISLVKGIELEQAEIVHRIKGTELSYLDTRYTFQISEHELTKAACCNLAESFETNPSIDVSFTDAVTGTRQIEMLGLAGTYTNISRENMPGIRGLASVYGLSFIPGPWIESLQLSKGTGSVVNGYEGVTGQLNLELRKPDNEELLYLNGFANEEGRLELNYIQNQHLTEHLGTSLQLHASGRPIEVDHNGDSFLDFPMGRQINLLNRWEYHTDNGSHSQIGFNFLDDQKDAGQVGYFPDNDPDKYGVEMNTRRYDGWGKTGFVLPDKLSSIGIQYAGLYHDFNSYFGDRQYDAIEKSLYGNLIYQTIIGTPAHTLKSGISYLYNDFDEKADSLKFSRTEQVPGVFTEYTYDYQDKFNAILGLRYDYHNLFGGFITPRIHLRYAFTEQTVLRGSVGKGTRMANIFAENIGLFSSARQFKFRDSDMVNNFDPEVAWNVGGSLTQEFKLNYRRGTIVTDFYRTWFNNQIIADQDINPQEVWFYNLNGESFSNSFQLQVDYELIRNLDIRMAYRYYDVRSTYNDKLQRKPLSSAHRAFVNFEYQTKSDWRFDATYNWQGKKRIPNTDMNPVIYQREEWSPTFGLLNTQITKAFDKLEIYVGGENLLNFTQKNPIIASEEPGSPYFDSSLIWGPISGRMFYAGFRFKIMKKADSHGH